jgi:hypothetical protein
VYLAVSVNTVLLPRALYRLKLSSASDEQIDQIYRVRCVKLLLVKLYYLVGTWDVLWMEEVER